MSTSFATQEQLDLFSKEPLDMHGGKNPNLTLGDIYRPQEVEHLWYYANWDDEQLKGYAQDWLKGTGSNYIAEMENLRGKINTVPAPLEPPPVPQQVMEHPAFYDAAIPTDPDEIERRIEEYNKALRDGPSQYGIDPYKGKGYTVPSTSFPSGAINAYREQIELAKAGVPYEEGAPLGERARAAAIPRSDPVSAIRNIAEAATDIKEQVDEFGYTLPNAQHLYPGRPPGQQGPVIRYERNLETGEIEGRFPFNEPGVTGGDLAHFVLREAPAVAGDIAATLATSAVFKARLPYYKSIPTKIKEWGAFSAAAGFGTATTDFMRYGYGLAMGYNEGDFEDAFKESMLIGAYASGGSAVATSLMAGARGTWNFITGKQPPDFIIERLIALRKSFQETLKKKGIKPGSAEAKALFDDNLGKAPSEVQKVMHEVTGKEYTSFLGENQALSEDANFALGMLTLMQKNNLPATKTMEIFQDQILNNKIARNAFAQKLLLEGGSEEAAKASAAKLGLALKDEGVIASQMKDAIEEQFQYYNAMIEEGKLAQQILEELGIDDAAILGARQADDAIPGRLGDETAVGENLLKLEPDPDSLKEQFTHPVISRLFAMQRQYMAPIQKDFDTFLANVGGLSRSLGLQSPFAKEIRRILKKGPKGDKPSILAKDKALRDWLWKSVDGDDIKSALHRLEGRSATGQSGGAPITFEELHDFRIALHNLRNQTGDKLGQPSKAAIDDLITAVEKQQNLFLKNAQRDERLVGNLPTGTVLTDTYWGLLGRYRDYSKVANNRFVRTFIDQGMDSPASLVDLLFRTNSNTLGGLHHDTAHNLFKILKANTESYKGDKNSIFNPETVIADLRIGIGSRYKRMMKDARDGEKNRFKKNIAQTEAHTKFMNKYQGLLDAAFDDPASQKIWANKTNTMAFMDNVTTARGEVIEKIQESFKELGIIENPETAILAIVRGEGLENASGAMKKRLKLANIIKKSGDPYLIKLMNQVVRKDIWSRITDIDTAGGGGLALTKINPEKLNELLTKDFVIGSGKGETVSFFNLYAPFMSGKELNNLKIINAAVQTEFRREVTSADMVQAAIDLTAKGQASPATIGRFIFGPLNKYTYRIGQRGRTLEDKALELMQEAVVNPEILDKLADQMYKKQNINQMIRFFMSLDSVIAHDIGRDLEEAQEYYDETSFEDRYGEEANQDMFGSEEYFNFFKELFSTPRSKERGDRSGIIPGRQQLEHGILTGPVMIGSGIASAASGVRDWWNAPQEGGETIVEVVQ